MVSFHIVMHRFMRRLDEKEWKCLKFFRIVQWQPRILQTRSDSLKPFIVSGLWWSVKLVLPTETQKSRFCVRPWSLLAILNFSERGRQAQRYFNVSTLSSRRDNKHNSILSNIDINIVNTLPLKVLTVKKLLGVTFNNKTNFQSHTENVLSKTNRKLHWMALLYSHEKRADSSMKEIGYFLEEIGFESMQQNVFRRLLFSSVYNGTEKVPFLGRKVSEIFAEIITK